jgi:parvulin-like peptidyl-prolyl isomerase
MKVSWLGFGFAFALVACSKAVGKAAPSRAADGGALVARVGSVELHEDDFRRAMARDPGASPERFADPAARRELIDGMVRFELLAQAADRAGFTKDPEAIYAAKQIAVTKFVNSVLGEVASPDSITRADLEREYAARQASEFTRPAAVQVRHIRVSDPRIAERLAAQAKALPAEDDRGFAALAATNSEDLTTRAQGGDLGFVDPSSKLAPALLAAALALKSPGEVAGPIATEQGYEILRLVVRRAAAVSPFSSVEEPLKQRLYRERRGKALDQYIAGLRAATPVELP